MNDAPIKNFAIASRTQLIEEVGNQMTRWAIDEQATVPATADVLNGQPLTAQQREQRRWLLERCKTLGSAERLREEAAYTWFNRIAAIRYMEVHDFLPCRLRFFSDTAGAFNPQIMTEALQADIEGVDRAQVAQLVTEGNREALFRYLLLAQCNELANAMPAVFDRVGAGMELLLPEQLLRPGSVVERIVTELPERDASSNSTGIWDNVEVLGWLYQHYNSELKDDFFKSKRKASAKDIGPATQLFTPEWIVRYMVENSLGRLWMLNFPESKLAEGWEYYIKPDEQHEDFIRISGPEDISLCDPACGSGHILVYAFQLLFDMYIERGYREREIPQLILEKNLAGMEIDPRAAQIANLALAMCAREHDRRFFSRGAQADICIVKPTKFDRDESGAITELPGDSQVLACPQLTDALEHLDEIGSLFCPNELELQALQADAERFKKEAESGDMFVGKLAEKLQAALKVCEALTKRFTCVVANPPYMGSSSFSPFMSKWIKKNYPNVKSDLCTCFIERSFNLVRSNAYSALVTMQSWMFLGSFEKMRGKIIEQHSIVSMAHIGTRGFDSIGGEVVSTTATVFAVGQPGFVGAYLRLVDPIGESAKMKTARKAIANPNCDNFYRRNAKTFTQIPGTPIAYWASNAMLDAFASNRIADIARPHIGIQTGDNDLYIKKWWEIEEDTCSFFCSNIEEAITCGSKWFPIWKGGQFRKWAGNREEVVNWENDGAAVIGCSEKEGRRVMNLPQNMKFCPTICWSMISSSYASFRAYDKGGLVEHASSGLYEIKDDPLLVLGFCNSSIAKEYLLFLSPTLNFEVNKVGALPLIAPPASCKGSISRLANNQISISNTDWDSFETSWDFKRHPLL